MIGWNLNDSQNWPWRLYERDHIRTNVVEVEVLNLSRVRCFTMGLCLIIHISFLALWKPHRSCFLLIINLGLLSPLPSMEWSSRPYSKSSQGHSASVSFLIASVLSKATIVHCFIGHFKVFCCAVRVDKITGSRLILSVTLTNRIWILFLCLHGPAAEIIFVK